MRLRHLVLTISLVCSCVCAAPEVVAPSCINPAPLHGEWHEETPGYLVALGSSWIPRVLRVYVLEWKYGFRADSTYGSGAGFFATSISPKSLAALRCDSGVDYVEYNMPVRLAASERPNKTMEPTR